jgi:hypothetical protein
MIGKGDICLLELKPPVRLFFYSGSGGESIGKVLE